jgi:nitrite reductase/ring-hydroxylating ferredoxin subunit
VATALRLICSSEQIANGGVGFCFSVRRYAQDVPAFAIRFKGQVFGYLNECGHVPARLDWMPGEFFDQSKVYLICSIHGALYAPDSGRCLGGRCQGKGLKPLKLFEIERQIFLEEDE